MAKTRKGKLVRIYKVKFGSSATLIEDTWLVRARNIAEALGKATKTATKKLDYYNRKTHEIVSVELVGQEE